jgi:hypothetical protein
MCSCDAVEEVLQMGKKKGSRATRGKSRPKNKQKQPGSGKKPN